MESKLIAKIFNHPKEEIIFKYKGADIDIKIYGIINMNGWYLSCPKLAISQKPLYVDDFDEAVKKAKEVIEKKLCHLQEELKKFLDDSNNEFELY